MLKKRIKNEPKTNKTRTTNQYRNKNEQKTNQKWSDNEPIQKKTTKKRTKTMNTSTCIQSLENRPLSYKAENSLEDNTIILEQIKQSKIKILLLWILAALHWAVTEME